MDTTTFLVLIFIGFFMMKKDIRDKVLSIFQKNKQFMILGAILLILIISQ